MTRIVVGIDEVGRCAGAVDWAVREATLRGAQLHLLHCCDRTYCRVLDETVDRIRQIGDDLHIVTDLSAARPEVALLEAARDAAIVVVGPPWNSRGLGELLARSTGMHIAIRARCPVVVAHTRESPADDRVVVGFARAETAEPALAAAFYEADLRRARLSVVMVKTTEPAAVLDDLEQRLITTHLQPWRTKYPDLAVQTHVLHGKPTWALTDAAAGAALLVVGPRRPRAHLGLRGESVTPRIVEHARSPVLIVRAGAGQR